MLCKLWCSRIPELTTISGFATSAPLTNYIINLIIFFLYLWLTSWGQTGNATFNSIIIFRLGFSLFYAIALYSFLRSETINNNKFQTQKVWYANLEYDFWAT